MNFFRKLLRLKEKEEAVICCGPVDKVGNSFKTKCWRCRCDLVVSPATMRDAIASGRVTCYCRPCIRKVGGKDFVKNVVIGSNQVQEAVSSIIGKLKATKEKGEAVKDEPEKLTIEQALENLKRIQESLDVKPKDRGQGSAN